MPTLTEIVKVTITKDTRSISRVGFGTAVIVGVENNVFNRQETFTDPASAKLKITGTNTLEEAMVNDIFAQTPSVTKILLGAVRADRKITFTGTMTAGTVKVTVNGRDFSQVFTTDNDTTLAALLVLIEADADVDATSAYAANVMDLVPVTAKNIGVVVDVSAATGLTAAVITSTTKSEAFDDALDAILLENKDFFGVVIASRDESVGGDQQKTADWAETNKKFFVAGSADADIVDKTLVADTTSIAAYAKTNALERTMVIYSSKAATEGIDAAVFGKILPLDPGTYTVAFKTLASITVDNITATQSKNAQDKFASTYETIGGVNIVFEGKVGANEFADVIIFIDFLQARMQEDVFATLSKATKIPFTDNGIASIQSAMLPSLTTGQNRGGISPDAFDAAGAQIGGFFITVPAIADVPSGDKATRTLKNVKFTAFLAGAIHFVEIDGIVTL